MARVVCYIRSPKAYNFNAAFSHISVLRIIKSHSFLLPIVRVGIYVRFAVPIFSVKLYDNVLAWHESINGKFIRNYILSNIINADTIKYSISCLFYFVGLKLLLVSVHLDKHFFALGVVISALKRTIKDIIVVLSGRRPLKHTTTSYTNVRCLVASLPFVSMFQRAKMFAKRVKVNLTFINIFAAICAANHFASFALGSG